ncbi:hypothetical protein SDC9_56531 [bioreactor metagenome]|uniref:Uncharacterized protein n=1 Tax=bioreactor metagenome TaxID=1076179 RepID=A0A644X7T2_9ZZZZ
MKVSEKLDFLMNLTKTTNSALSQAVSLDASYISRLRRGERSLRKKEEYIKNMASYFARHCCEPYQHKALCDAISPVLLPAEESALPSSIARWLLAENEKDIETIENFLDGFSGSKAAKVVPQAAGAEIPLLKFPPGDMDVFYGIEGKRQAVIYFLSQVAARDKPQTLLLFSDEATDWMTTSPQFAARWFSLMTRTLVRGNRIKIIHTINRDLDEMMSAISQWMPLYMSGSIEPYFYPKKRDGIFKRTLFIAPETAAVISNSIGSTHTGAANILFREEKAVKSFADEYNQYLALCRPLMRIFTAKDEEAYLKTLSEFEKEQSDTIIKTESLSLLTMPESLARSLLLKLDFKNTDILGYHKARIATFLKNLRSNRFTEIIQLTPPQAVAGGKVKIAFSNMLSSGAMYYTGEEYVLHLKNLISLLDSFPNFHIYIADGIRDEGYTVYAREDLGTIVAKTSTPAVVLAMNENNMAAAFWDFLLNTVGKKFYENPENQRTADRLRAYIREFEEDIK